MSEQVILPASPTIADLRARRDEILEVVRRHRAYNVRVFGSVARGDAGPDSDIDLLVAFRPGASLFDLSALWQDLQELLGRDVNVISEAGMKDRFRRRIADDVVPL